MFENKNRIKNVKNRKFKLFNKNDSISGIK